MVVDDLKKYVHVAIPRTATTCVNVAIGNLKHPEPNLHHAELSEILNLFPHSSEYFKFSFVRNPFDRLVSIYHEFRKNRGNRYSEKVILDKPLLSEFDVSNNDIDNFRNFCSNLQNSNWINDLFFKPQFNFLTIENKLSVDFIGKFENIDNDWLFVRDKIGFPNTPLQKNVGGEPRGFIRGSNHQPYQNYYTQKEIDIVSKIYKKDLDLFGYEFE